MAAEIQYETLKSPTHFKNCGYTNYTCLHS